MLGPWLASSVRPYPDLQCCRRERLRGGRCGYWRACRSSEPTNDRFQIRCRTARDPKATVISGRYLFPTVKGGGDEKRIARPDDAETRAVLSELCDTLRQGLFIPTSDKEDCKFCELGPACGGEIANARAKLKMANEANTVLKPFRKLREHD